MLSISDHGVSFIKSWEGFVPEAYQDIAGVWTIGYGHTRGFNEGRFHGKSRIDEAHADRLLRDDLTNAEQRVNSLVHVPLKQSGFDALVSFEFNTGGLARSTALKRLNAGDRAGAAQALTWWCKARVNGKLRVVRGLKLRRDDEAALFLSDNIDGDKETMVAEC